MPLPPPLALPQPGLFGLHHANRDFTSADNWGKNQFNSSFPAALSAYLETKGFGNIYLKLDADFNVYHSEISTSELYGANPTSGELYYAFESLYTPFEPIVSGHLPRTDLVTKRNSDGGCLRGLEVKLTALPDNSTAHLGEADYGCELVVRPDTIVYLACSLALPYRNSLPVLKALLGDGFDLISQWQEGVHVSPLITKMVAAIDRVVREVIDLQEPLLMQPIWKTQGKSPQLADNCLDVFVWSNLAFIQLFLNVARDEIRQTHAITRQVRTVVWLFKMLYDFSLTGQINHRAVFNDLTYGPRNDKAFAVSGRVTNSYMRSGALTHPRIEKRQIKEIILGGGQQLLSPERRFDAIVFNSPELFI